MFYTWVDLPVLNYFVYNLFNRLQKGGAVCLLPNLFEFVVSKLSTG